MHVCMYVLCYMLRSALGLFSPSLTFNNLSRLPYWSFLSVLFVQSCMSVQPVCTLSPAVLSVLSCFVETRRGIPNKHCFTAPLSVYSYLRISARVGYRVYKLSKRSRITDARTENIIAGERIKIKVIPSIVI